MEKWQLSVYWPNVISVVRGHAQTSMIGCVCITADTHAQFGLLCKENLTSSS